MVLYVLHIIIIIGIHLLFQGLALESPGRRNSYMPHMPLGKDCRATRNRVIAVVRQHLHVKKLLAQASFEGQL